MPEPASPHLSVQLRHRIGALQIDVAFQLTQPWTILFGPSGSGKTTILRAIAGLLHPDDAHIVSTTVPGTSLESSATLADTRGGILIPPHKRGVRLAAQQPSLFPHMTVFENLMYGAPIALNRYHMTHWVDTARQELDGFGLSHLSGNRPDRLSGGEAQRLNLARAVAATGSHLLLLDEPFTGMDDATRDRLLGYLKCKLAGNLTPVLSVTHDIAEALQLNAEVIKLSEGRIVAQGPAATVLAEERSRLLAQLNQPAETPASPAPAPA